MMHLYLYSIDLNIAHYDCKYSQPLSKTPFFLLICTKVPYLKTYNMQFLYKNNIFIVIISPVLDFVNNLMFLF